MAQINLRKVIDKIDRKNFCKDDLLNMYEACQFNDKEKIKLVEMASRNQENRIKKYITEKYDKKFNGVKMYCNPSPDAFNASMGEDLDNDYDLDEGEYFTTEDLDKFLNYIIEEIERNLNVRNSIEVYDADIDDNIINITLSFNDYEEQYKTKIDMKKIKVPSDLIRRYADEFIEYFTDRFQEAINNEDIIIDEAYYGGAFDIEDDQYFTRDDLNEFGYELEDKFREAINAKYGEVNLVSIYLEDSELEVTIGVGSEYEATKTVKVDMRKIRTPKDLYKYMDKLLNMFLDDFRRASVLYRAVYTDSKDKEHEIYVFETEFDKEWPYIINIDGVVTGRANHDNLFKELDRELKDKFGEGSLKRKNLDEEALSLAALAIPMLTSAAQGFGQSVGNKLMDKI